MGMITEALGSLDALELFVLTAIFILIYLLFFYKPWKLSTEQKEGQLNDGAQEWNTRVHDRSKKGEETDSDNNSCDESAYPLIPYEHPNMTDEQRVQESGRFLEQMSRRRSVRQFSSEPVPMTVIENIVSTAGTGPSGANLQPWTFAVVVNERLKSEIRQIVEMEERINYERRMGADWVRDVSRLRVDWEKGYLEEAPVLVVIFKQVYRLNEDTGKRQTTYYNEISTAIAVGLLLAAIQKAGLCTVTSTPLNAGPALQKLLNRPVNEKVVLLLPIGHAAKNAMVPQIKRKSLDQIMFLY